MYCKSCRKKIYDDANQANEKAVTLEKEYSEKMAQARDEAGEIIKQAKDLAAEKALVWPLFYTGAFYLIFVGFLTIVLGKAEKKLGYFRS